LERRRRIIENTTTPPTTTAPAMRRFRVVGDMPDGAAVGTAIVRT
jgi:hypothetical protein